MEATGGYGLCADAVLEQAGLEVRVVNGKHVQNLPGRKPDMRDCQWIATLHAHGLLRSGFVAPEHLRCRPDYRRLRSDPIPLAAGHELHLQKAFERLNVKRHAGISDGTGVSGLKRIRAILAGERDPEQLLALCDAQIQKQKAPRVRESLRGTGKEAPLFALRPALEAWEFDQQKRAEWDQAGERVLRALAGPADAAAPVPPPAQKGGHNTPQIQKLHGLWRRRGGGKDPTVLPGVADYPLLQVIGETGTERGRNWKTEKPFTAWLGWAPGSRQSGQRRGSQKRGRHRAGRWFCVLARSVGRRVAKALGGV